MDPLLPQEKDLAQLFERHVKMRIAGIDWDIFRALDFDKLAAERRTAGPRRKIGC